MPRLLLRWGLPAILVVLLAAAAALYGIGKQAEPAYAGARQLSGLQAPVEVTFGPHAVPTIRAASAADALFAQGYVIAAERLWQMDLMRRLAAGRLAEVLGADALVVDRYFRTLGLATEGRRTLDALDAEARSLLLAYAAGVNTYQQEARDRLPLEYRLAGFAPAPWRPEDSLAIGAYMSWSQSYDLRSELVFLRLAKRLGAARAAELFWVDEGIAAPKVPAELVAYLAGLGDQPLTQVRPAVASLPDLLRPLLQGARAVPASNAWVVTGTRTATGEAMLANDPHLAIALPGIWYELELLAPDLHVAGVALPGVPLVMIGHNADLAWGFTTVIADTQDLAIERLTEDGTAVVREGRPPEPLQRAQERLEVKGGAPELLEIRRTSRGVVIDAILGARTGTPLDLVDPEIPDLLVLTANDQAPDASFRGLLDINRAPTLEAALCGGEGFRHAVMNLMLAHSDGGIAWGMTGALPERGRGTGAHPTPGWLPDFAWRGTLPQSRNPRLLRPANEVIVTANHRTLAADDPLRVSNGWLAPYRAQRIEALIAATPRLTADQMQAIQADRLSLRAQHAQHRLRQLEPELRALDPEVWRLAAVPLLDWDGVMRGDSQAAALFALLKPALYQALYGDELREDLAALMDLAIVTYTPLDETLRTGRSAFWDDVTTEAVETPAHIWARALRAAHAQLGRLTGDAASARLAAVQRLAFPHAFDAVPLVGRLFRLAPVGVGGSDATVDVMKALPTQPLAPLFAASMRVVATPGDWGQSRGTLPLGQSGHRFSAYRSDQLGDWLEGRAHPWPWNGPTTGTAIGALRLEPAATSSAAASPAAVPLVAGEPRP